MNKAIIIMACIVLIFQIIMFNESLAKRDRVEMYAHGECMDQYRADGAVDFENYMKQCMSR